MSRAKEILSTWEPIRRPFNVWKFLGCTVPQPPVIIAKPVESGCDYQNEYQQILWSGMAWNREDALEQFRTAGGSS